MALAALDRVRPPKWGLSATPYWLYEGATEEGGMAMMKSLTAAVIACAITTASVGTAEARGGTYSGPPCTTAKCETNRQHFMQKFWSRDIWLIGGIVGVGVVLVRAVRKRNQPPPPPPLFEPEKQVIIERLRRERGY
jgi:hypothetical protein